MKNPLSSLMSWFKLESELGDIHQKYVHTGGYRQTNRGSEKISRSLLG
jgi:hypothetical protein